MKAKVTHDFSGCPDGEAHPRQYRRDDVIEGDLARAMIAAGYAQAMKGAPKNQALGGAPENQFPKVAGGDGRPARKRRKSAKKAG